MKQRYCAADSLSWLRSLGSLWELGWFWVVCRTFGITFGLRTKIHMYGPGLVPFFSLPLRLHGGFFSAMVLRKLLAIKFSQRSHRARTGCIPSEGSNFSLRSGRSG